MSEQEEMSQYCVIENDGSMRFEMRPTPRLPEFPSLYIKHERPHAWIQWKGTDVCCDIHCKCGASLHFDGRFMYHVKCSECGQVYEMDGHIEMHPLDFEPENTHLLVEPWA